MGSLLLKHFHDSSFEIWQWFAIRRLPIIHSAELQNVIYSANFANHILLPINRNSLVIEKQFIFNKIREIISV